MDSKMIRNALMVSVSLILIIFLAVIMGNWQDIKARLGGEGTAGAEEHIGELSDSSSLEEAVLENGGKQVGSDLSGFMSDEDFFDADSYEESSISVSHGKTASLILSTVEKDLKIHIVDVLGKNIPGVEFTVSITNSGEGIGEYRDSDKDGIIYVEPIPSGECTVTLHPQEGFQVPDAPSSIVIRQQVEYVAINPIDLVILTEDEIDPSKEDTASKAADDDRDATEQTEPITSRADARMGIDVSKWNKEIDWDKVREAGVEFAIIRVGYRGYTSGSLIEDPYFADNIRGAINAGIPVGVYFFSQAITPVEAVEEASMVIELCKNYRIQYPVFLDSESTGGSGRADNLTTERRTEVSRAFLETIQSAGYDAGIYGARNWFYERLDMDQLSDYIAWLAEYREVPLYQGYYQMWQYSSKGAIDGIDGNVDLNLSYLPQ